MKKKLALMLALCLLLTGCSGKTASSQDLMAELAPTVSPITIDDNAPQTMDPEDPAVWENALVADFGLRLFRASFREDTNTLISPFSVLAALSMTANGAAGQTLTQMETVLGQPTDGLNNWYRYGVAQDDVLHMANGIWFRDTSGLKVEEAFLQKNADHFGAGIYKAPFDQTTLADINGFVEENTKGMVKDIVKEIPEEAMMYLVNALSFEAQWQEVYEQTQVYDSTFTTEQGEQRQVELMHSQENLYLENDLATGFLKPYKTGDGRYAFAALLPKEGVTVKQLVEGLDGMQLQSFLANPQQGVVLADIPKFEISFETDLSQVLASMGMGDAFDPQAADFSAMGTSREGNLCISRVLHKTYISVAEQGTKAGAATVVEMACGAAFMPQIKEVVLDRPFLYMIVDRESNTPIFMGALMDIA